MNDIQLALMTLPLVITAIIANRTMGSENDFVNLISERVAALSSATIALIVFYIVAKTIV
jgi:uncharacterized membrane protein